MMNSKKVCTQEQSQKLKDFGVQYPFKKIWLRHEEEHLKDWTLEECPAPSVLVCIKFLPARSENELVSFFKEEGIDPPRFDFHLDEHDKVEPEKRWGITGWNWKINPEASRVHAMAEALIWYFETGIYAHIQEGRDSRKETT